MKLELRMSGWLAALVALIISGCEANHYEIEMTPTGDTVQRELTCWRSRTANNKTDVVAFPEAELARIAAAYDAPVPGDRLKKHTFAGAFTGAMPEDVGGSGSYTYWNTSLGSVSAYVERFRGDDDLLANVEQRLAAADHIADLLIGWLASELQGEPGFAELREFLDKQFRRDLKNLSLYSWASGTTSVDEEAAQVEMIFRAGKYLVERSYFTPDQLPALARAVEEIGRVGPAPLLAIVQRFAASKMGIANDQPIPASLQFFADPAALKASIDEYLRRTDDFQQALEAWNREQTTNPETEPPQPMSVLVELVTRAFLPSFHLGPSDQLSVKLAAASEPYLTNGQWDERDKQVRWSHELLSAESEQSKVPKLLYALVSRADERSQQAHFGRVVLDGSALGRYCLWHRGLAEREAKEWDEFVASLRPGDELSARLLAFRFSHEPPEPGDNSLAATPRELILPILNSGTAAD